MRAYERAGATATHWILGALLIVLPVTGYLISTSEGAGIDVFGLFEVPAFFDVSGGTATSPSISTTTWHTAASPLVGIHAIAALKHTFIDKDRR